MKLIVIGDIHGRDIWKDIIKKEKPDITVFLGDYFDSFTVKGGVQLKNFNEIVDFKDKSDKEVIMLYGNHEHHYTMRSERYSGHQPKLDGAFNLDIMKAMSDGKIQVAYSYDDLLFTHAGVSTKWLEKELPSATMDSLVTDLNELFKYRLRAFNFVGRDMYGDYQGSSPIWIRETALLRSNKDQPIKKRFIQVVGHSEKPDLNLDTYKKYLGGRYIFADTLSNGQYLIYNNKELSVGKIEG